MLEPCPAINKNNAEWVSRRAGWLAALTIALLGCADKAAESDAVAAPHATPAKVYQWKIITTWPKFLPGAGMSAENLAERLRVMSDGRLDIRVYGAGELVGAFEVFDAVSAGTAEMGHGAAYYWRGKMPIAPLFTAIPFGMTAQEVNAWLRYGGGLELWRELYAPFNVVPFAAGNTGVQMAGWFNEEINALEDLAGLKMRIPGLGGEVLERSGGVPVTIPGGEVFTALQTGVIDATEWVGPYNDLALGLYSAGRYYYYPGWHEPGAVLELIVNRQAFEALPADLQAMVATTAQAINDDTLSDYTARSVAALETLEREHDVLVRPLPDEVIGKLREASLQVVAEAAGEDELSQRIYASYTGFMNGVRRYTELTEKAYLETR
ncbi:MAG: TRAP transporter substrate-binding protein [Gammaproteobacteria bacterium]|nr:TRAP transporter substrate-binding protein [Gammaproteobacteria bacterium]MYK83626.1 TRAP transporter substrate-binding protein [Gammaproteobacteria bacterium]